MQLAPHPRARTCSMTTAPHPHVVDTSKQQKRVVSHTHSLQQCTLRTVQRNIIAFTFRATQEAIAYLANLLRAVTIAGSVCNMIRTTGQVRSSSMAWMARISVERVRAVCSFIHCKKPHKVNGEVFGTSEKWEIVLDFSVCVWRQRLYNS